jgi:ferredoxin-thioredoxin reductase catalytic subunit
VVDRLRSDRWWLHGVARELLHGHEELGRVSLCCRIAGRDSEGKQRLSVSVGISAASYRATMHEVGVCGSVWACPVCASRIQEQRK